MVYSYASKLGEHFDFSLNEVICRTVGGPRHIAYRSIRLDSKLNNVILHMSTAVLLRSITAAEGVLNRCALLDCVNARLFFSCCD